MPNTDIEIARRLTAGGKYWETVVVDEAGGGLPDPSGEPDGDVLTVSSGAAVWAPGGGSQTVEAITFPFTFATADIVIAGSGVSGVKVCDLAAGDSLVGVAGGHYWATNVDVVTDFWNDPDNPTVTAALNLCLTAGRGDMPGTPPTSFAAITLDAGTERTPGLWSQPSGGWNGAAADYPLTARAATAIYAYLDDAFGADPGSVQGVATLTVVLARAS